MEEHLQNLEIEAFEKYVNWLQENLNHDVDPAQDLLSYVPKKVSDEGSSKIGKYCPTLNPEALFKYIIEDNRCDHPLMKKVRAFYKSVEMNPRRILEDEGLRDFCGGFPIIHDNWRAENFSWIRAAAMLSAMGISTIFSSKVQYEDDSVTVFVERVMLDSSSVKDVQNKLTELQFNEEQIRELVNDFYIIHEKLLSTELRGNYNIIRNNEKSFEEFSRDSFDYQVYFDVLLGKALNQGDNIHTTSLDVTRFDRFLKIFMESPTKSLANYIAFMAVNAGCSNAISLTSKYFSALILAAGYETYIDEYGKYKHKQVRDSFAQEIKEEGIPMSFDFNYLFHQYYQELKFLTDFGFHDWRTYCEEPVLNFDDPMEVFNIYLNVEAIAKEYEAYQVSDDNFFQNIVEICKSPFPKSLKICSVAVNTCNVAFEDLTNILHHFVSYYNMPMLYHFSRWPVDYCHYIFKHVVDDVQNVESLVRSIENQLRRYGNDVSLDLEDGPYASDGYLCGIEALRLTFKSYKTWLNKNEALANKMDELLEKVNLNCSKVFFVAYSLWASRGKKPRDENCIEISLGNSAEFAEVFGCEPGSKFSLEDKVIIEWIV